jgi:hypothetical protein
MSKSTNDYKYEALLFQLSIPYGHIDDMEYTLILAAAQAVTDTTNAEHINDLWYAYLKYEYGFTGHINDMMYAFLAAQGYTGHINDMWQEFWEDFIGFVPVPAVPYEFEMLDTSIQNYEFDGGIGPYELQLSVI